MLNCFRTKDSNPPQSTTNSTDLPEPWIRYYNEEGAQLFYNRDSKLTTHLNPTILKEVQAEGKTGRDAVVQMKAKTGEIYGVDYGCVPEGKIVYMPMELKKEGARREGGEEVAAAS